MIVAPTWRSSLAPPLERGSQRRTLDADAFWDSDYCSAGSRSSARQARRGRSGAARLAASASCPTPTSSRCSASSTCPTTSRRSRSTGSDVQGLYARLGLLVTDYSSVAFNAAYLDRPTVYYQFDRDALLAGGHVGRPGYFDYERDGFGPVTVDHEAAVSAIVAAIRHGATPEQPYADRITATFPDRDGRACERVVAAIEELSRPWVTG